MSSPGALVPGVPFSFDPTVLRAARTAAGQRIEQPQFIAGPLPPPPPDDVALADLVAFFKNPVKGFFRALDFTLPWDVDGVEDAMPVDIDALEEWKVGDRMLNDILRGMTPDEARQAEWRRGHAAARTAGLAQGQWRSASRSSCSRRSAASAARASGRRYDVDIDLGAGRRLTGTVSPVFGDRLVSVTYSKLDGRHLLESWIPLLALIAHDPSRDWSAVCIGRQQARAPRPRIEGLGWPDDDPVERAARPGRDLRRRPP